MVWNILIAQLGFKPLQRPASRYISLTFLAWKPTTLLKVHLANAFVSKHLKIWLPISRIDQSATIWLLNYICFIRPCNTVLLFLKNAQDYRKITPTVQLIYMYKRTCNSSVFVSVSLVNWNHLIEFEIYVFITEQNLHLQPSQNQPVAGSTSRLLWWFDHLVPVGKYITITRKLMACHLSSDRVRKN